MNDEATRKRKFECRVLAWRELIEGHGGWEKAAKFFKMKKVQLHRQCLDDLDEAWGEKINWGGK